jgi:hypothetical protein
MASSASDARGRQVGLTGSPWLAMSKLNLELIMAKKGGSREKDSEGDS